jgi:hypothetical protein
MGGSLGELAKLGVALLRVIERLGGERLHPFPVLAERSLREVQRGELWTRRCWAPS